MNELKKFLLKQKNTFAFLYIVLISYIASSVLQSNFKSIDPPNPMDQVSAVAFGQIIFWTSSVLCISLLIFFIYKKRIELISAAQFFLVTLIGLVSGVLTGSAFLALRGTQWYFGLLGGDLGVHLKHAQNALEFGWDKSGYPPLWSTIVGNISHFLNLDVYISHKDISINFIVVWIGLTYIFVRQAFPIILSEFLTLSYAFSLAINGWKYAAEYWTQILLLALIKVLFDFYSKKIERTIKTRLYVGALGFAFGCSIGLYYGRIWWIGYALAFALFLANFINDTNNTIRPAILDFFISAFIPLIPTFLLIKGSEFGLSVENNLHQLLVSWLVFCTIWYFIRIPKIFSKYFSRAFVLLIPIGMVFIFPTFSIGDTFTDEGRMFKNNFVPSFGIEPFLLFMIIFVVGAVLAFAVYEKNAISVQLLFLMLCMFSSILNMFYYAYEMHKTNALELFPRAGFAVGDSWQVQIVIYTYLIGLTIFFKFKDQVLIYFGKHKSSQSLVFFAVCFAFVAYFAGQLGSAQWALFPRPENEAYYAWISSGWTPN